MSKLTPGDIQLALLRKKSKSSAPKKRVSEIDLALSVMCTVASRDETLNTVEIAELCGCSQTLISQIARDALNKLRGDAGLKLREFY